MPILQIPGVLGDATRTPSKHTSPTRSVWQRLQAPRPVDLQRSCGLPCSVPFGSTWLGTAPRLRAAGWSSHADAFPPMRTPFLPCVTPTGRVISARCQRPSACCSVPSVRATPLGGAEPEECCGAVMAVNFSSKHSGPMVAEAWGGPDMCGTFKCCGTTYLSCLLCRIKGSEVLFLSPQP